jgi:hypothetical protein
MEELFQNDKFLMKDFFHFICGDLIGKGRDRRVYSYRLDASLVVKIETGLCFANVEEWRVWNNLQKDRPDLAKFLAPCVHISDCGRVMLQRRTQPLTEDVELLIPDFMWDIKRENWGMINNELVCHDYANNIFHRKVKSKIVKASFYE